VFRISQKTFIPTFLTLDPKDYWKQLLPCGMCEIFIFAKSWDLATKNKIPRRNLITFLDFQFLKSTQTWSNWMTNQFTLNTKFLMQESPVWTLLPNINLQTGEQVPGGGAQVQTWANPSTVISPPQPREFSLDVAQLPSFGTESAILHMRSLVVQNS